MAREVDKLRFSIMKKSRVMPGPEERLWAHVRVGHHGEVDSLTDEQASQAGALWVKCWDYHLAALDQFENEFEFEKKHPRAQHQGGCALG
jgi:hypothetical protein